jgi:hypothetical protein
MTPPCATTSTRPSGCAAHSWPSAARTRLASPGIGSPPGAGWSTGASSQRR